MPSEGPSPERIRAALDELLGWQGISRSPQLAELLRYVVERTLAGDEGAIKAYSIAVDVFGRPQSFDPQSDPIVRVQARRLRTLLEQFYDAGLGRANVQIRLPLGRYVPEFRSVAAPPIEIEADAALASVAIAPSRATPRRLSQFWVNALLSLTFTLVGVGLAVAIVRWTLPGTPAVTGTPDFPVVTVGSFDNLTGEAVLDDDIALAGNRLAGALRRFDWIRISDDAPGLRVSGSVREQGGRFIVNAILGQGQTGGIVWSTTINAPLGVTDNEALAEAMASLAAQLGNASGPLHAPGRAWLKLQTSLPDDPGAYVCDLLYMSWRDSRSLATAEAGIACYGELLARTPQDGVALAASAGIGSWRAEYLALPGSDLVAAMADDTTAATQATALASDSSFVYEQQAIVLARQGSVDAAIGAVNRARELNADNMDALSVLGILLWLKGEWSEGNRYSEQALAAIPSAPPWYFQTRALHALHELRYFDAIGAAQALSAGDEEFGPVIALAAAPLAGRTDLIDRYRPVVLDNVHFQETGILPRLAMRVPSNEIIERVRAGLLKAGISPIALDRPFNPDGTAKD